MWLRSTSVMAKRGRNDVAGEWKAVLELASAIHAGLDGLDSDNLKAMTIEESRLRKRIKDDLRSGSIAYSTLLLPNDKNGKGDSAYGLASWLRQELWWLLAFIAFIVTAIIIGFWHAYPIFIFVVGIPLAMVVPMTIGSSGKSRAILFMWDLLMLCIVPEVLTLLILVFGRPRRIGGVSAIW